MQTQQKKSAHESQGIISKKTLLVFNCHEAWVYQLGCLGYKLDIIVGLAGRYKIAWDEQMRPLPLNSRLVGRPEDGRRPFRYHSRIERPPP